VSAHRITETVMYKPKQVVKYILEILRFESM